MTSSTSQQLIGRTAVVTGSSSGIGAAIGTTLAAHGASVIISGRDAARGAAVVDRITADGGMATFVSVDLCSSYQDIRDFARAANVALGGRVDILVNNAGIYPATATADLPDDQLDAMLAVNVRAPHVLVGELAPSMAERGSGVIVNIGSWMAAMGSPFAAMYSATKAADEQLVRSWAAEFGPRGVRVNALAPGATLTPGNEDARSVLDSMTAGTPAGKVLSPQNIADGVLFLVSDSAAMVHGTTLYVDGGIAVTRG
ncbi:putative short chain dehydrogenase [Rhodococcus sp. AW25M09]|uniref:SDR family NAD(P)-dependent oxidoreductase n=1 Tax=Rhodococcus sp. AW25M09 TaxID=1268303 RepID=UPI0002AD0786|nr:SDR family oxidoreductase [Rhodococcus sp. AW25M09]CCQ15370.1 putative short chain dehydrogenase [Rhodococcus sp. AW25M09]